MNELGPRAKQLLEAGRGDLEPTSADQARIRELLRARLTPVTPNEPVAPAHPKAVEAAAQWPVVSGVLVGAGLVAGGVYLALSGAGAPQPPPEAHAVAAVSAPSLVPSAAPPQSAAPPRSAAPASLAESSATAAASPAFAASPEPARSGARGRDASRLGEEVELLSRATTALHGGRPAEALELLAQHQRQFPRGALTVERRAARAQALCQLGRAREAERELQRLPANSPQAARARQFCADE